MRTVHIRTYFPERWCLEGWAGQSLGKPGLNSALFLLWAGGWSRHLLMSLPTWIVLCFCNKVPVACFSKTNGRVSRFLLPGVQLFKTNSLFLQKFWELKSSTGDPDCTPTHLSTALHEHWPWSGISTAAHPRWCGRLAITCNNSKFFLLRWHVYIDRYISKPAAQSLLSNLYQGVT